jgi:uncharacterized protein (UPF0332 family)
VTLPPVPLALARATATLVEANKLWSDGHLEAAVNRAYYATVYASMALLSSIGLEPKTHDGLRHLVNLHFVKPGVLDPHTSRTLAQLETLRNDADYDLAAVFVADDVAQSIGDASTFVAAVARVLEEPQA